MTVMQFFIYISLDLVVVNSHAYLHSLDSIMGAHVDCQKEVPRKKEILQRPCECLNF